MNRADELLREIQTEIELGGGTISLGLSNLLDAYLNENMAAQDDASGSAATLQQTATPQDQQTAQPVACDGELTHAEGVAFDRWWAASKYCQVVNPEKHWKQIALDAFAKGLRLRAAPAVQPIPREPEDTRSTELPSNCAKTLPNVITVSLN